MFLKDFISLLQEKQAEYEKLRYNTNGEDVLGEAQICVDLFGKTPSPIDDLSYRYKGIGPAGNKDILIHFDPSNAEIVISAMDDEYK